MGKRRPKPLRLPGDDTPARHELSEAELRERSVDHSDDDDDETQRAREEARDRYAPR